MPLSHAQLWTAIDGLARQEGLSVSALAKRAGLDATSFKLNDAGGPFVGDKHPFAKMT